MSIIWIDHGSVRLVNKRFNDEQNIQKVGTSMGRDCDRYYADIYIKTFEKDALLKLHTFSR